MSEISDGSGAILPTAGTSAGAASAVELGDQDEDPLERGDAVELLELDEKFLGEFERAIREADEALARALWLPGDSLPDEFAPPAREARRLLAEVLRVIGRGVRS